MSEASRDGYRSVLLDRHGAVAATGLDAAVAAHYGDPLREQRSLALGEAVVDHSHRGVVTVTGPDRLSWLNTLSSQDVSRLRPGDSTELLLLNLQGRIEHDGHVLDDGERVWLIVEAEEAAPLAAWLDSMKFMLKVEIADVSGEWGVLAGTVPLADVGPERVPLVWQDPWPEEAPGGYSYSLPAAQHPGRERRWYEHLIRIAELPELVENLEVAGSWAAEALRIAAWRPRWGAETDEKTIPHELDLLRTAVHLAKGCYKGQETVARVHNLGRPPRRLAFLHLDGSQHTMPAAGAEVFAPGSGERPVGKLTSVAQHYEMGPVALALLKRSADPEAELLIRDGETEYSAAQEVVVSPEAGQVVGREKGFLRPPR